MANLSIYQNLLKPPKSIQEYDDEHAQRQVNMLGLKEKQNALASYERGLADESATREAYAQSAGDQNKVLQALKAKGLYKPAMSIEKAMLDTQKTTSDIDKTKADTYKQKQEGLQKALDMSRSFVQGVSSPAEAAMYLKGLYAHPDLGPIISSIKPLEAGLASLPQDPQGLERWKAMHMGMTADKLMAITMPKTDNTNMGGYHSMGATDQFTGKRIETGQVLNTQSPDNAATQVTSIANNAATNAQSNANSQRTAASSKYSTDSAATNSRLSREQSAAHHKDAMGKPFEVTGQDGKPALVQQDKQGNLVPVTNYGPKVAPAKPMPTAAVKLQNSELESIGTFAGLDADLKGIQKQMEGGKLEFGPIKNITNTGKNLFGMSSEQSRNLATFKSKMENMRNAVLLLNKGVQTEGDAIRAMSEIMANINDPGVVKQRLEEVRALNQRAVTLRKNNVDALRREYSAPDFDYSKFENQPGTTNLGGALPSGWSVKER